MISITGLRQSIGLGWPNIDQKRLIWSRVKVPSADITDGYTPSPSALKAHMSDARAVGVSGGAGAGKSLFQGMDGVTVIPYAKLIWIVGAKYRHCRPEFEYLTEAAESVGLMLPANIHLPTDKDKPCSAYSIEHEGNRCTVETVTLHDYQKQAATKRPDLMIVCEPGLIDDLADMEPTLWGRLGERRGRLLAAGTSEESSEDWFQILQEWGNEGNVMGGQTFLLPTWENLKRYPQGRDDPEFVTFEKRFGNEMLMMRYGGVPAPPKGLVLKGYWSEDLFGEVEFDPSLPMEIFIDPNYMDPARYVIGFVQWDDLTGDINVIDEIAAEGCTHPEMIARFKEHELSKFVFSGCIDPHAGDHHPLGSESPLEYWGEVLPDLRNNNGRQIPVRQTVQSLKTVMTPRANGKPRLRISNRCERGKWEGSHWKLTAQGKPRETACDFLKGLGYWVVEKLRNERAQSDDSNIVVATDYDLRGGRRSKDEAAYWREYEKIYKETPV